MNPRTETSKEASPPHPTASNTRNGSSCYSSPIFLIRVLLKKTAVDPTVASTGLLLLPSFFASTRMPTTLSRPASQDSGCLHKAPTPLRRRPLCPPGPSIGTLTIQDGRGCGLAKVVLAVERTGLDLWSLMDTSKTKTCPNNWQGYDARCAASRPSHAEGAQGGVGVGSQDHINRKGGESTRLHGTNVGSCESVQMVSNG